MEMEKGRKAGAGVMFVAAIVLSVSTIAYVVTQHADDIPAVNVSSIEGIVFSPDMVRLEQPVEVIEPSGAVNAQIIPPPVADLKKDVPCGSGLVYDATSNRCRSGLARDVGRIRSIM